jgi:hypothetical protein
MLTPPDIAVDQQREEADETKPDHRPGHQVQADVSVEQAQRVEIVHTVILGRCIGRVRRTALSHSRAIEATAGRVV